MEVTKANRKLCIVDLDFINTYMTEKHFYLSKQQLFQCTYFYFFLCYPQGLHARNEEGSCLSIARHARCSLHTCFPLPVHGELLRSSFLFSVPRNAGHLSPSADSNLYLALSSFMTHSLKFFHNSFGDSPCSSVKVPLFSTTSVDISFYFFALIGIWLSLL